MHVTVFEVPLSELCPVESGDRLFMWPDGSYRVFNSDMSVIAMGDCRRHQGGYDHWPKEDEHGKSASAPH